MLLGSRRKAVCKVVHQTGRAHWVAIPDRQAARRAEKMLDTMRIVCYTKVKQSKGASPPKAIHYVYSVNLENGTQVPARPEKCMLFGYLQSVVYATRRRAGERVKIVARFTRITELRGNV